MKMLYQILLASFSLSALWVCTSIPATAKSTAPSTLSQTCNILKDHEKYSEEKIDASLKNAAQNSELLKTIVKNWMDEVARCATYETYKTTKRVAEFGIRQHKPIYSNCFYIEACINISALALLNTNRESNFDLYNFILMKNEYDKFRFRLESDVALVSENGSEYHRRNIIDQALRKTFLKPGDQDVSVTDQQLPFWRYFVWRTMTKSDVNNMLWLEQQVRSSGWPTEKTVGKKNAETAWLIAQHSDFDVSKQLYFLKLMKPLAEKGKISAVNFAYLSDRVDVALFNQQTYGTQFTCRNGRFAMDPLRDTARAEQLRRQLKLPSLKEKVAEMAARAC